MAETTNPVEEKIEEETSAVSAEINVDENHESLTGIRADQEADVNAITEGYGKQIDGVDTMVQGQIDAIDESTKTLTDAQNKYTEDTINIIEGQKQEARDDLADEQRGAYVDWKQQTDPFGVNAEHMAANGLSSSGFSESSKVRMFQAYQNRKAQAYKAFTKAMTEYNNQITNARNQNSVTLAQIASDSIKEKARITLEGFYYKNDLITKQTEAITETNRYYDSLWLDQYDRLYEQEKDKRDFLQRQEEERQAQANWEALYGENGLYRKEEEEEELENSDENVFADNVIIDKGDDDTGDDDTGDDVKPDLPPLPNGETVIPPLGFNPTNPTLSSGIMSPLFNSTLDVLQNDELANYPNFPTLPNGASPHLTLKEVGKDNIHSFDETPIKKAFGNISAQIVESLVNIGLVKEVLYKDKDGKIGLTWEIVDKKKAKAYVDSAKLAQDSRGGGFNKTGTHTDIEGYRVK